MKFNHRTWEWFSWAINRLFDLKDYENYCKNIFIKSIIKSRDEFVKCLQEFISSNEEFRNDSLLAIRSFIEKAYEDIPVSRRIIQMDSFSKFLFAVAIKVAVPELYHEYWRPLLVEAGANDFLRELEKMTNKRGAFNGEGLLLV